MATSVAVPPSPKMGIVGGHILEMRRDPLAFLTRCAREFGDVVYVKVPTLEFYLLSGPDEIEQVMSADFRYFIKGSILRQNLAFIGNGLLTSEGEFWKRQRRLIQPTFHRRHINNYASLMVDATAEMLAHWHDQARLDVHAEMMALTLDIVSRALFSADVKGDATEVGAAVVAALEFFSLGRSLIRLPESWPLPRNIRNRKAQQTLDRIVYRIIRERRASGEDKGDLLSLLLAVQDEDGSGMTEQQLRDEVMTMFLAGHETTASTLSWACYLLATHPDVAARLAEELQRVLGGRIPTLEDLPNLRYTEAIINETLRLYPPAWRTAREAAQDCEIGGYSFPQGTIFGIAQWVVQRDPRFFDRPDDFDPARWEGDLLKRIPKYAYFPFGGGQRICIGISFAMMESVLVLAMIAQRYRLTMQAGQKVTVWPSITIRPKEGVKVVLHKV